MQAASSSADDEGEEGDEEEDEEEEQEEQPPAKKAKVTCLATLLSFGKTVLSYSGGLCHYYCYQFQVVGYPGCCISDVEGCSIHPLLHWYLCGGQTCCCSTTIIQPCVPISGILDICTAWKCAVTQGCMFLSQNVCVDSKSLKNIAFFRLRVLACSSTALRLVFVVAGAERACESQLSLLYSVLLAALQHDFW